MWPGLPWQIHVLYISLSERGCSREQPQCLSPSGLLMHMQDTLRKTLRMLRRKTKNLVSFNEKYISSIISRIVLDQILTFLLSSFWGVFRSCTILGKKYHSSSQRRQFSDNHPAYKLIIDWSDVTMMLGCVRSPTWPPCLPHHWDAEVSEQTISLPFHSAEGPMNC